MRGDQQFYNSKTHRGRMCFWTESKRVDEHFMDENLIRDDVTKNCEKNVDQNQFRENNALIKSFGMEALT